MKYLRVTTQMASVDSQGRRTLGALVIEVCRCGPRFFRGLCGCSVHRYCLRIDTTSHTISRTIGYVQGVDETHSFSSLVACDGGGSRLKCKPEVAPTF